MGNEHKIQMTEERAKKLKDLIDATGAEGLAPEGANSFTAELNIKVKVKWEGSIPSDDSVQASYMLKDDNWTASNIKESFLNDSTVILRKVESPTYPAIVSGTLLNRSSIYGETLDYLDIRLQDDVTFCLASSVTIQSDIAYDGTLVKKRGFRYVDLTDNTIKNSEVESLINNTANYAVILQSIVIKEYESSESPAIHLCMVKPVSGLMIYHKDSYGYYNGFPSTEIAFGNGFYVMDGTNYPIVSYKPTINIKESSSSSTKIDYEDDKIMFGDEFYLEDGYVRSTGGGGQGGTPETITYLNTAASVVSNNFHPKNLTVSVNNNGYLVISFDKETITQVTKTVLVPSSGS